MGNFIKSFFIVMGVFCCQQTQAMTRQQITKNANERLGHLASSLFQSKGYSGAIKILNGGNQTGGKYQNDPIIPVVSGDTKSGGPVVCVEEGKVVSANEDAGQIGKNVSNDPVVKQIIEQLKNSSDEKVVISYDGGKKTAVAWGRKALMGEKLDKTTHSKFFGYITFDNPGS